MSTATIPRLYGRLTGPRGTFRDKSVCTTSQFDRFARGTYGGFTRTGWRWVAFDAQGKVLHVIECGDDDFDGIEGALWTLREIAAGHFHIVRAHRGH